MTTTFAPHFQMDPDTEWQGQLLDSEAEDREGRAREAGETFDKEWVSFTPELTQAWNNYNYDLRQVLGDYLSANNLDPDLLQQMYDADAEYNVYMTLRGHGVGIWDGRWKDILTDDQIEDLTDLLTARLGKHVDDSGGGQIDIEMDNAVYRATAPVPNSVKTLKRRLLR